MENIYHILATDTDTSEDGSWMKLGKDIEIKVRRYNSKKTRKVNDRLYAPYQRILKAGGKLEEDTQDDINTRLLAEGVIADWKGITDKDGNKVDFSVEAAIKLLNDLPDLKQMISSFSLDMTNYLKEKQEEVAGN